MQVAQITHHFYPCIGGMETFALQLCNALTKKGIVCKVICLNKCPKSAKKLKPREKLNGIEVVRIPFIDLKFYKVAPTVLSHIKDADILHVHGIGFFSDFLILTRWFHKKPIVVQSHGGIFHTKRINFLKKIYFNVFERLLLQHANMVILDSRQDFDIFKQILPTDKLLHIENAVSLDDFKDMQIKKEKNSFLFVGRISANKRVALLIKTFAELKKLMPDAKLYVVGSDFDNSLASCKALVEKYNLQDMVIFLGALPRKKLLDYYAKSEYIVSASSYEGFGISIVEGMAACCIPLLSNIPQFNEFLKPIGHEYIIAFENPQKAAAQIAAISKKDKKVVVRRCRERAAQYSWDKRIADFCNLYNALA